MSRRARIVSIPALMLAVVVAAGPSLAEAQDGPGVGEPWIVSLGDSAISGEGGRWAGNSNQPAAVVDALGDHAYDDGSTPGPIAIGAQCLDAVAGHEVGSAVAPAPCDGSPTQIWDPQADDTVRAGPDLCLAAAGIIVDSAVELAACAGGGNQQWQRRGGRLVNIGSALCASASTPSGGTPLLLADCTGGASDQSQVFGLPDSHEQIDGCHRSHAAAVHIDRTSSPAGPPPQVGVRTINFACSGARTYSRSYTPGEDYKPGIDFAATPSGLPANHKGQALQLQEFATDHNVTGVALLIGANNLGYAQVLETCVLNWFLSPSWWPNYCSDDSAIEAKVEASFLDQLTADIEGAIDNARLAMTQAGYDDSMYTIFVHTYWSVIPVGSEIRYSQSGYDRQTLGGCGFWNVDADWGEQVARPALNGAVLNAVAAGGHPNVKVVDLGGITRHHELCSKSVGLMEELGYGHWSETGVADDTEWVTQVRIGPALPDWLNGSPPEYQLQEGGHANYWGQLAMRSCLRQAYNGGSTRSVACVPASGGGLNPYGEPNLDVTVTG